MSHWEIFRRARIMAGRAAGAASSPKLARCISNSPTSVTSRAIRFSRARSRTWGKCWRTWRNRKDSTPTIFTRRLGNGASVSFFFFFVSLLFIRPERFFVYRNICSFESKNSFLSHFCVSLKVTDISPCNRIIWAPCIYTEFQFLFLSPYVSLSVCYSSSNPRKKPNHLITIINLGHTWYPASPE